MRKWRRDNRLHAQFSNLRTNAKERHIAFDLTFEQFEKLATEAGYSENTNSTHRFALTLDRKDARDGYTIANLGILTRKENLQKEKYDKEDHYTLAKI